ncbi:MAG TPA: acetyl-CoA carboxylase biotin carboxyl carrier protein subunit [Holosporales bacterium]|nr:acetyl-CoA carboxylase biotin carboxyl carrier protein subunit [Holosporales bacterium]
MRKVAPFHYSILHENKSFDLRFYDNQKIISLFSRGKEVSVEVEDMKSRARKLASGGGEKGVHVGEAILEAQMPGKIVSVKVKVGDEVVLGQGVVVVEAMKMENEMTSPKDGVVKLVAVKEGQSVESGTKLVVIE